MVTAAERLVAEWRAMPTESMHAIDDEMTRVTFQVTMLTGGDAAEEEGLERSNQSCIGPIAWPLLYAPFRLPNWLPFRGKSGRHRGEGTCGRRLNASCASRAANSVIATTSWSACCGQRIQIRGSRIEATTSRRDRRTWGLPDRAIRGQFGLHKPRLELMPRASLRAA
jgi:hypothetical protein